jgi:hypothetical protein
MFLTTNIRQYIAMTLHNLHALYNDRGAFSRIAYYDDNSGGIYVVNDNGTDIRYSFSVARHDTDPNIIIVKLHNRQRSLRYTH